MPTYVLSVMWHQVFGQLIWCLSGGGEILPITYYQFLLFLYFVKNCELYLLSSLSFNQLLTGIQLSVMPNVITLILTSSLQLLVYLQFICLLCMKYYAVVYGDR